MLNEIVSKNYMIAGYFVFITIPAAYIVSLFLRWRNLKRDIKTIKEIQK
jgi:hypothetical protein